MITFDNLNTFKHFVQKLKEVLATISYVNELDANNLKNGNYNTLNTSDKTILGSINEINSSIQLDFDALMEEINEIDASLPDNS